MAHNKVVFGNETLIDMSNATVTVDDLAYDVTAYDKNGELIRGRGVNADTVDGYHIAVRSDGAFQTPEKPNTITFVYGG